MELVELLLLRRTQRASARANLYHSLHRQR